MLKAFGAFVMDRGGEGGGEREEERERVVGEVGEAQLMGRKRAAGEATQVRLTTVRILDYPSRRRIPLYMHGSRFVLSCFLLRARTTS